MTRSSRPKPLLARAKDWVLAAKDADLVKPWDAKGYKMPGGAPYHPAGFMTFVGASAMVQGKTQGVYPAARALLSAVYEGALVPSIPLCGSRRGTSPSVLMNPGHRHDPQPVHQQGGAGKGANRPQVPDQSVEKLGIIGAGMMGAVPASAPPLGSRSS